MLLSNRWQLVLALPLLWAGCAEDTPGATCRAALQHTRQCLEAHCAEVPSAPFCGAVAGAGAASAGVCEGARAEQAEVVSRSSCDELIGQAAATGKADGPCPWYFAWCDRLAPDGSGYEAHLVDAASDHATIQVDIHAIEREAVVIEGKSFESLRIAGASSTRDLGAPALPTIGLLVGVPWDATGVTVETPQVLERETLDLSPAPYRGPQRDMAPAPRWTLDRAAYADPTPYPAEPVVLARTGVWRDYRVARLELRPAQVVASLGQVTLTRSLRVTVRFTRPGRDVAVDPPSGPFAHAFEANLINVAHAAQRPAHDSATLDFLYVVDDALVPALQPLVDARVAAGKRVQVVRTSEIQGTDPPAIKRKIAEVYAAARPAYVVLVGPTEKIPVFHDQDQYSGTLRSDQFYAYLDGDDLFADVALGRLPAHTPEELTTMVQKTLAYEHGDPAADWRRRFLLVAHREEYPEKYSACVKSIVSHDYGRPIQWTTMYGAEGGSNAKLTEAINAGVGIISYRGHGDVPEWDAWGEGGTYRASAQPLANAERTPVVFSVACLTGRIEERGSLAEQMMLRADGAVAFLGATEESWTIPNHDFNRHLFGVLLERNVHSIGALLVEANTALLRQHGDDDAAKENAKMYLWVGDPSLEVGLSYACDVSVASAGADVRVAPGGSTTLGEPAVPGTRYTWAPSAGLSCSDCAQPVATPGANTTYTLVAENGCSRKTDEVVVAVGAPPDAAPDAAPPPDAPRPLSD